MLEPAKFADKAIRRRDPAKCFLCAPRLQQKDKTRCACWRISARMPYQVLVGSPCYTPAEEQKLLDRINYKSSAKASRIRGQWLYYVHHSASAGHDVLDRVRDQLLRAADLSTDGDAPLGPARCRWRQSRHVRHAPQRLSVEL